LRLDPPSSSRRVALIAVKTTHTVVWLLVEASMAYVLIAGIRGRSDRSAGMAGAIVAAESLVFLGNGAHCPLTAVAQSLGAKQASVTDIYLPRWIASNLPVIHVPFVALAIYLHGRALMRRSRSG